MSPKLFLDGKVKLYAGDCREVLAELEENSVDSCVTDPPYHLTSIVKRFGKSNLERDDSNLQLPSNKGGGGTVSPYKRVARGFMGKQWDGGDVAFDPATWDLVLRVLKPGGHLLAFGGTRTYHSLASAIEQAGFEVRDAIMWHYGSGFPKSHDISKAIDRLNGHKRGTAPDFRNGPNTNNSTKGDKYSLGYSGQVNLDAGPVIDAAKEWQGWGTALKPSTEIICLARKPLSEASIAANVLKWGCGALNIDRCRVEGQWTGSPSRQAEDITSGSWGGGNGKGRTDLIKSQHHLGRWPANLCHDGSEEVLERFPETQSGILKAGTIRNSENKIYGKGMAAAGIPATSYDTGGDQGSAARFFYSAKADIDDRLGSKHPTVKPVDLMAYLVRLITPKDGLVLDPFSGTGTTGEAAFREGLRSVLIEREPEYLSDIEKRMSLVLSGPDERRAASVKQLPPDDLPMFQRGAA